MGISLHALSRLGGLILLGLVLALTLARPARAVPPAYFVLADARVDLEGGKIEVKISIDVDNPVGLYEMLKDGAAVDLIVNASLERRRTLLPNVNLGELEFVSALRHNPLTRQFSLYLPDDPTPRLDKSLTRLIGATWHNFSFSFGTTELLAAQGQGNEYRVSVTLALQHAKPPPWLVKDFMFWSKNIVETEKLTLDFVF